MLLGQVWRDGLDAWSAELQASEVPVALLSQHGRDLRASQTELNTPNLYV